MASTQEKLYVTYVDVDRDLLKIWGQRNRIGATYIERQLLQLVPEFNKTASPNPSRIHKGMLCFAKYTDDNYYRARVISRVQEDSVGVLFVDYGNRDIIKLSNIRIQEGNEGDVLTKMCEQAEEYYLATTAAPPSGWTIDIVSEIRRDICYDEFHYKIIGQIGDQKILEIQFRDEDFSSYLVKRQLARPLSLPVQRELILSYCSLVSNEIKHGETYRGSPRMPFSPSVPPPSLRIPLRPANPIGDMSMQLNYAKANKSINFPGPPTPAQYSSPRHLRAPFHQNDHNIPKNSYFSQISNRLPVNPSPVQSLSQTVNPSVNHQINQFYQRQGNATSGSSSNNNNLIEIIAQQVKQYFAKDVGKSDEGTEDTPHHYVNTVLEVGNTYNAVISHIDDGPWSFSIQFLPSEDELKKLMKELSSIELVPIKPPIILGHPCIALSGLHGSLCRGVVVSISRSAVKVYFVDFGNTEDLPSSSIYELPHKFFKVGVLSQKFSLSGLQKVTYSDDIKKFFEEVIKDEVLVLRVDSLEGDNLPTCELYIKQRNIKRILNEKMREFRSSFTENLPKIGDTETVMVTWVISPQKFFVQMKKRDQELTALKKELSEVESKCQMMTYQQLSVGFKCVCLYESDRHWYRVVITSVDAENEITVFYVDYGNTETVNISRLRKVDGPCLINQLGNQAVQCCLKGFENQPYNPEWAQRLEALTLEKEFQMTVASLENHLLCVTLTENGNDISAMLLTQTQPKTNDQLETSNISEGSNWDLLERENPAFSNNPETESKPRMENSVEKRDTISRGNQFRSEERESRADERTFGQDREVYWSEPKVDHPKPWKTRGSKEFGNWDSIKIGGSRGQYGGRDESQEGSGNAEKSRGKRSGGWSERKSGGFAEKKFGERNGKRFDSYSGGGEESKRRYDSRREKSNERQSTTVPIKKENVAPPGTKFQYRNIEMGSSERGLVTYYFGPDEFFVQLLSEEDEFKKMMAEIQNYYSDKQSIRDPVKAGDIVIAQFSGDKLLYRAEVIKPSPVTVRYVDYGNREPVSPKSIWFVDKEFLRLPEQVVKCRLSGVHPIGSDWPPPGGALDKFFEFPEYKCTFVGKEADKYDILLEEVDSGNDMTNVIIAAGLARPPDPELNVPETDYSLLEKRSLRLFVSYVESPSEFYVCVNPKACELIKEAISTISKGQKSFTDPDWSSEEPEMPCLVALDDGSWCRGHVRKTEGENVSAWLCDRGDRVELPKEKVKRLPDFLKNLKPQAIRCSMFGVFNVKDQEEFKMTVEGKSHLMHVSSVKYNRLFVVFYDDEGRLLDFEKGCGAAATIDPIGQLPIFSPEVPLVVSEWNSVKEVYIQRIADGDSLINFLEQLNNFYAEGGEDFEGVIRKKTLVAAKSIAYDSWYRARVISSEEEEQLIVSYVDYGNKELLPRENIKKLDSCFLRESAFCTKVALDLDDSGESGKEEKKLEIWELFQNKDIVGYFKNKKGNFIVELSANGESMTEDLKRLFSGAEGEACLQGTSTRREDSTMDELRVFVSHIDSPARFWVHKEALINDLRHFQDKLKSSCESLPDKETELKPDEVVGVFFSGMWCRGRVVGVERNVSMMQFIDYGKTSVVDTTWTPIKDLSPDLAEVEVFATQCALKGDWGEGSTLKLEEIILRNEEPVSVVVLEEGDPLVVDLFEKGRSITEMLLEEMTGGGSEVDDDLCTVYITHSTSPEDFYIQRETCTEALNRLANLLYDAASFKEAVSVEEGELYAAKYPEDGLWYRARVIAKMGEAAKVFFVDYGNTSIVRELKLLTEDIAEVPSLSENCSLAYGERCDSWSEAACEEFAEYADGRVLKMKVVARVGNKAVVKLFEDGRSIIEALEELCEEDERVEMLVTHLVSPRELYVRYVEDEEYKLIEKGLRGGGEDLEERKEGRMCKVRSEEGGGWLRGRIERELGGGEGYEVLLVDFGKRCASKELKKLPKELEEIPGRALKCSLNLGEGEIDESSREELMRLMGGGGAVFRGRIVSPGETNIVSLKIDGRILEESLNVTPGWCLQPKSGTADETKEINGKEVCEEAFEGGREKKEERNEEEISFPSEKAVEGNPSMPKNVENGMKNGGCYYEASGEEISRNDDVDGTVPESTTRGEKEERSFENGFQSRYTKLKLLEKVVPGSISRGISLEVVPEDKNPVREAVEMSRSAPNTPRSPRRSEYVKRGLEERLLPGCISTGMPLHWGPGEEDNVSE